MISTFLLKGFASLRRKSILFLLIAAPVIAFILGFCVGATDFHESFKGVSWTNILSSITTLLGFLLAFASYNQWLRNKKEMMPIL